MLHEKVTKTMTKNKKKVKKVPLGMHMMADGMLMKDNEMKLAREDYHKLRGARKWRYDMTGGRML